MKKRGAIEISFGMIFSIIIIAFLISVAVYIIYTFMGLGKCTEIGLFYQELQKSVDKAWSSDKTQKPFEIKVTKGIEKVCFGNLSLSSSSESKKIQDELKKEVVNAKNSNVFLYPTKKACDSQAVHYKISRSITDNFFCVDINSGKSQVILSKEITDSLVKIKND